MRIRKDKHGLAATDIPSDLDIAWAAGIYEGEGSCVQNGREKNSFSIVVSQKDPEFLYRMRDLFGGSINLYNEGKSGLVNGRFEIYHWVICGDRARVFLAVVYSYLTTRRKAQIDATSARRFLDRVGEVPRNGALPFVQAKLADHVAHCLQIRMLRKKRYQKNFYETRKASDPTFMEKRRAQTQAWRSRSKVVAIA